MIFIRTDSRNLNFAGKLPDEIDEFFSWLTGGPTPPTRRNRHGLHHGWVRLAAAPDFFRSEFWPRMVLHGGSADAGKPGTWRFFEIPERDLAIKPLNS